MKQTLKSILGVGAIALLFYILFSILNFAQSATPDPTQPLEKELNKKSDEDNGLIWISPYIQEKVAHIALKYVKYLNWQNSILLNIAA